MVRADWCHREPEFAQLTRDINERIAGVYQEALYDYASVMLTGSGTCAVEAMLSSFAPREGATLVVANGVYGERMAQMLEAQGKSCVVVKSAWLEPMALDAVEDHLRRDRDITHIAAVHHETTTGRLNDIDRLGGLCRAYDRPLLLDAVSSFGAEEILFDEWNIEAAAATANKCLHGAPGISFVLGRKEVLQRGESRARSVYLDLFRYFGAQHGDGFSPFTQAVPAAFALQEALVELEENGGWQPRGQRYRSLADAISHALQAHGVRTLLARDVYSSVLWSYELPEGITYDSLHDALRKDGFVIYAGQGNLAPRIFRIAHMGDIRDADLRRLESALGAFFD